MCQDFSLTSLRWQVFALQALQEVRTFHSALLKCLRVVFLGMQHDRSAGILVHILYNTVILSLLVRVLFEDMETLASQPDPCWFSADVENALTLLFSASRYLNFSSTSGCRVVPRALILRRQPVRHPREAGHHLPAGHPACSQDPRGEHSLISTSTRTGN